MADFADTLRYLESFGILDVLVPFILVFTIVFAVLQKTKILGTTDDGNKPRKNFNVIISLVLALAVVIPHVTGAYTGIGFDVVDVINGSLPQIALIIIAVIMLLLLIGAWGAEVDISKSAVGGWVVILSILVVAYIFATQAGWVGLPNWLYWLTSPGTQAIVVTLLVFGLIVWFVTKEDSDKGKDDSFFDNFTKIIQKGGGK